jgi:hypothetical protein
MPAAFKEKLAAVNHVIDAIDTKEWRFEKGIDKKARKHLKNLLIDYFPRANNQHEANIIELDTHDAISECFVRMMQEYRRFVALLYISFLQKIRWCAVSKQEYVLGSSEQDEEKLTLMLMLLMIYGSIDVLRSQGNVCLLLFHAAKKIIFSFPEKQKKAKRLSTFAKIFNAVSPRTVVEVIEPTISSDDEDNFSSKYSTGDSSKSETPMFGKRNPITPREQYAQESTMHSARSNYDENTLFTPRFNDTNTSRTPRISELDMSSISSSRRREMPLSGDGLMTLEEIENEGNVTTRSRAPSDYTTPSTPKQLAIARFICQETHFLYKLIEITYDKGNTLRNEQYFDWDDLNDLCWTPGFVEDFLTFEDSRFANVFSLSEHYPAIYKIITATGIGHAVSVRPEDKKDVEKQCLDFAKQWKTYFDRSGGPLGITGLFTIYLSFDQPLRINLFCLFIVLLTFAYTQLNNTQFYQVYYVIPCTMPLLVLIFHHIFKFLLRNRTAQRSKKNPYRNEIPRRDAHHDIFDSPHGTEERNILDWLRSRIIQRYFSGPSLTSFIFAMLLIVFICFSSYVLFAYAIQDSTESLQDFILAFIAGQRSFSPTDVYDYDYNTTYEVFTLIFTSSVFVWIWIIGIIAFFSLSPLIVHILTAIVGFGATLLARTYRIRTWEQFCAKINDPDTIYVHFVRKLLAQDEIIDEKTTDEHRLRIEWCWATIWNTVIDDFYQNYLVTKEEKVRLSYILKDEDGSNVSPTDFTYTILKRPDLEVKPSHRQVVYQLCTFMNNLWKKTIPRGSTTSVEDMKRLVLLTPVNREKVLYSWKELVKPANTDYSFLRTLIVKHHLEWYNWKDRQFPEGNKLRNTVNYIESKVLAGIDITGHQIRRQLTSSYVKDQICNWASSRYRSLHKTTNGFLKIAKALEVLLKVQSPHIRIEKERDEVIKIKFSYIIGALGYDEKLWHVATNHHMLTKTEKERNTADHDEYVSAITKIFKEDTTGILRVAHLEATEAKELENKMELPEGTVLKKALFRIVGNTDDDDFVDVDTVTNQEEEEEEEKPEQLVFSSVLQHWKKESDCMSSLYHYQAHGCFSSLSNSDRASNLSFMSQFFDGSVCSIVDCDTDTNLCQCLFIPNLLQEFDQNDNVKVLSCASYIYTSRWSLTAFAGKYTILGFTDFDSCTNATRTFDHVFTSLLVY